MKTILINVLAASTFFLTLFASNSVAARAFWEIRDSNLPYIAMVRAHPSAITSVIYNPELCQEIGDACGFFRDQADAHAHLNHLLLPPDKYPKRTVDTADCFVAKNGRAHEVLAAYKLFLEKDSNKKWPITGDPILRAENVRKCAIEADNWLGS